MNKQLKNIDDILLHEFTNLKNDLRDFKNEDTKELTHSIHNYPAVMIYPISRNILHIVNKYQDINSLLDPFMGSGTVLLEALLAGCNDIYGNDLNPLAQKISKAKTTLLTVNLDNAYDTIVRTLDSQYRKNSLVLSNIDSYIKEQGYDITAKVNDKDNWGAKADIILNKYLQSKNAEFQIPNIQNLGFWFVPRCIIELQIIKNSLDSIDDVDLKDYCMIAFSETTRLVSNRRKGEFKMYRMTREQVLTYQPNVKNTFLKILLENFNKMKALISRMNGEKNGAIHLSYENAKSLSNIPNDSIDIVITSPPYGDSRTTVAYGQFSRVSLQWCDYDKLSYKEIINIDKSLMGGIQFKKGFENNLTSPTLQQALSQICSNPNNLERAGDVFSFYKDLYEILDVVSHKCKKNAYQFWVVGNRTVKEVNLKTDQILVEFGENLGLKHILTMDRTISNKVMPSLNSPTNQTGKKIKTMTKELIVIFRKE